MDAQQIRLECLKLAVATPGFPEKIKTASEYVAFITDGAEAEPPVLPMKKKQEATEGVVTTTSAKGRIIEK